MIKHMLFFANGNVACFNAGERQVYSEQTPLVIHRLLDMIRRGVVDDDTVVESKLHLFGPERQTVSEIKQTLRDLGYLQEADTRVWPNDGETQCDQCQRPVDEPEMPKRPYYCCLPRYGECAFFKERSRDARKEEVDADN